MITRPTLGQVLASACAELRRSTLPALDDQEAQVATRKVLAVLDAATIRARHEADWMREEIDAVRAELGHCRLCGEPRLAAAVSALDAATRPGSDEELRARYDRASEALALAGELCATGDTPDVRELRAAVHRLLGQRSAHEFAIIGGGFEAVDRSRVAGGPGRAGTDPAGVDGLALASGER